jgi:hypothetical protein
VGEEAQSCSIEIEMAMKWEDRYHHLHSVSHQKLLCVTQTAAASPATASRRPTATRFLAQSDGQEIVTQSQATATDSMGRRRKRVRAAPCTTFKSTNFQMVRVELNLLLGPDSHDCRAQW